MFDTSASYIRIMSLIATDDWKLTTSPVVRLKRLNETFVLCTVCFFLVSALSITAVGKMRKCVMRKVKCGMRNAES